MGAEMGDVLWSTSCSDGKIHTLLIQPHYELVPNMFFLLEWLPDLELTSVCKIHRMPGKLSPPTKLNEGPL